MLEKRNLLCIIVSDQDRPELSDMVETVRPLNIRAVESIRFSWDERPRALFVFISRTLFSCSATDQLKRRASMVLHTFNLD